MVPVQRTLIVVLVLSTIGGCSRQPPTYVVHGTVVYPDGKPLTEGTVEFETTHENQLITATGEINSDGTFQVGTFEANDGAVAGQHRVAVISEYQISTGFERPGMIPPPPIDPKFRDFDTSGLTFEIYPKKNNILVEIDYAPPVEPEGDGEELMTEEAMTDPENPAVSELSELSPE